MSQLTKIAVFVITLAWAFALVLLIGRTPFLPLALCLGALSAFLTFHKPKIGLIILIFSMLLSPEIPVAQIPGREVAIRADDIMIIMIFFAWIAHMAVRKELGLIKSTPLNGPILLYLGVTLLFTGRGIIAEHTTFQRAFFYFLKYTEYFLIYFMASNIIQDEKDLRDFLKAGLIVACIMIAYGWYQVLQGMQVSTPFEGVAKEPATYGGYMLIVMGMIWGFIIHGKNRITTVLLLTLFLALFFPFMNTLSRASYVGFFALFGVLAVFAGR